MAKENGYVGRVKNSGTQKVEAPYGETVAKKGTRRITGNDLRTGTEKNGK